MDATADCSRSRSLPPRPTPRDAEREGGGGGDECRVVDVGALPQPRPTLSGHGCPATALVGAPREGTARDRGEAAEGGRQARTESRLCPERLYDAACMAAVSFLGLSRKPTRDPTSTK